MDIFNWFKMSGKPRKWTAGAINTHREFYISAPTKFDQKPSILTDVYGAYISTPTRATNTRIIKYVSLGLDLSDGQSISDAISFSDENAYDEFVKPLQEAYDKADAMVKYPVQIKEPSGVLVSYTFELFKKILFPKP